MTISNTMESDVSDKLRQYIERIEEEEQAKAEVAENIKAEYAAAKSDGFCTKTMRKIIALRKKDREEREEEEQMLEL